ncbi:unnamed protein product [Closterium sp. NIES-54]
MATVAGGRSWAQDRFPSADTPPDGELAKDLATTEAADDGLARGGGQVNRGMGHVAAADISAVREPMRRAIATDASVSMDQIRCAPYPVLGGRGQSTTRPLQFPRDPESDESPDDSATTSSSSSACDHAEAGRDCDPGSGRGGGVCDTGEGSFAPCGVTSVLRFRNLSHSVASRARKNVFCKINTSKIAPLPSDESAASDEIHIHVDAGRNGSGSSTDNLKPVISHSAADIGRTAHDSDRSSSSRRILVDISGSAKSGQITAIMGASGAGKTTLLNILACRIASGRRAGEVELDGLPVRSGTMRRVSAYVMQDDIMFPSLTVRETLMFAAELRLPQGVRREEKAAKVARLLELLGLAEVAETKIGDEGQRGVSGGERKRVAIGTEIICDPKILFLDEPTSGLDSTSAFRVVRAIKDIATNTNSIAVMVLHQPSFRVLGLVDRLILLASGHAVFHGAPPALPRFLESVGFPVPQFANSTEYALDLIEDMQRSSRGVADLVEFAREYERQQEEEEEREMKLGKLEEEAALRCNPQSEGVLQSQGLNTEAASPESARTGGAAAASRFWNSRYFQLPSVLKERGTNEDVETGVSNRDGESGKATWWGRIGARGKTRRRESGVDETQKYGNGWFAELAVLTRRNALITFRTPALYLLRMGLIAITGIMLATIFFQPNDSMKGFQERLAFFSFAICVLFFVSCDAVPIFIQERNIFLRETSSSAYRPSTYLLSSTLVYLPLHLLMALTLVLEAWWCLGLQGGAQGFCFMVLACFAMLFTGNAIATCVSICINHVVLAYAVAIALMAYFALLSGFYIDRESIPEVWMWLHYLSPMKYAYEALAINEFGRPGGPCYLEAGTMFDNTPVAPYLNATRINKAMLGMRQVLAVNQLNMWENVAVLLGFGVFVRFVTFLLLVRFSKAKQQ